MYSPKRQPGSIGRSRKTGRLTARSKTTSLACWNTTSYADSEFSWLTDEPAEETEPADAASEEPEKAQTMNMQTEETQTPEETKEEQQS